MTTDLVIVLVLLAAAVAMFVLNKPRMDAVALIMIVALPLTGVITVEDALAGFSDPNIVLIAALFVIGEGLVRTGVARGLGDWMNARAGSSETRLVVLLMATAGGLGALMSSTAVVAIFIPVVLRICQNTGVAPSRLMMPLSFAALISGMLTLVATAPNLVVNSELVRQGFEGFASFSVTVFGVPVLVLGILYMLVARRWLAAGQSDSDAETRRPSLQDWSRQYRLADSEHRVRVLPASPVVGKSLEELALRAAGVNLLAIERGTGLKKAIVRPRATTRLQAGDVLLIDARASDVEIDALRRTYLVEPLPLSGAGGYLSDRTQDIGMVEVIVPAESALVGRTVLEVRVRREQDLTVVGLRRGQSVSGRDLLQEKLQVGDTLLLVGFWKDIEKLQRTGSDLVILNTPVELEQVLPAASKAPHALGTLALVVALMVSGVVPNVQAALIGCLLMGLFGCIDMNGAYRSISWQSLVLIVGMLPFSIALRQTGGIDLAADALLDVVGEASPRLVLTAIFLITMTLGMFISNTATAVLMAPVALAVAADFGASPYPFAMTVALAASTAFITPVSSPVNTLVVVPGNYRFGDFVRIGLPFSLIVMAVSVFMVPLVLPLK